MSAYVGMNKYQLLEELHEVECAIENYVPDNEDEVELLELQHDYRAIQQQLLSIGEVS